MCLRQVKAVSIEGHPAAECNGLYTHDSTHKGWPVLKSADGKTYCYRYTPTNQWRLSDKARYDEDLCVAAIVAKEGPLPVGACTWGVSDGKKLVDRTLTVGLLVRPRSLIQQLASCSCQLLLIFVGLAGLQATQSDVSAYHKRVKEAEEANIAAALAQVEVRPHGFSTVAGIPLRLKCD
eukprot:COSAG04_NODE_7051_length_1202_cov_1.570263_2_plen_179_part_00